MVDNLALLFAHILLTMTILRSLKADKAQGEDEKQSWRKPPRA